MISRIIVQNQREGLVKVYFLHYGFAGSTAWAGGWAARYVFTTQPVSSNPRRTQRTICSCLVKRFTGQ
jgi:hypothetical protein